MKGITAVRSALLAAALAALGIAAAAQPGQGPGFEGHRPPMERLLGPQGAHGRWWNDPQIVDQLKLTDDQRKAMDQILLDHREKLIDMRASVEKAELAMEPLMSADQPNESEILSQIDKVAQARAELEKANARFLLDLRSKLTPDQWKQLEAMRNQRHERRQGTEQRWRNGGQGRHQGPPPQGAPGGNPPPGPGGPQSLLQQAPGPDPAREFAAVPDTETIE